MLTPGLSLFVAMQSNNFQDYGGGYPSNWKDLVKDSQTNLQQNNFFCPQLDINFRNTTSIFETSNNIKKDESHTTIATADNQNNVLGIPTMGTTLDQSPVKQIAFNWQIHNVKQADLDRAVKQCINTLQNDIDFQNAAFIILYDEKSFTMDQVYNAVKLLQTGIAVHRYPVVGNPDPESELQTFLATPMGCLITTEALFKGSEAENIVSLLTGQTGSSNIRGTILRAVGRLYILHGLDESDTFTIVNVINDDSLLHCLKQCNVTLYECTSCNQTSQGQKTPLFLCMACVKTCHKNHEVEARNIQRRNLEGKCKCTNHTP
jgi:hypothetical protein